MRMTPFFCDLSEYSIIKVNFIEMKPKEFLIYWYLFAPRMKHTTFPALVSFISKITFYDMNTWCSAANFKRWRKNPMSYHKHDC